MKTDIPLRPKMLDDIVDVRAKLLAIVDEGRGHEVVEALLAQLVDLRERHASAEGRLHALLRKIYGRSSEKTTGLQLEMFLAMLGVATSAPPPGENAGPNLPPPDTKPPPKKKRNARKPLPDHLPVEVVEIPVPAAERLCGYCGKERTSCGHEVARLIEYTPPSFKIIEERREKLVCRPCGEITTAPLGTRVIEGGRPGPQLVATPIVDKWIVERELRRVAIGHKNFLFAGSTRAPNARPSPTPSSQLAGSRESNLIAISSMSSGSSVPAGRLVGSTNCSPTLGPAPIRAPSKQALVSPASLVADRDSFPFVLAEGPESRRRQA